jgi:hypothetical protein
MTIPEAIEAMRRNVGTPNEALSMAAFADVWEEHEANTKGVICRECHARLWLPDQKSGTACDACNGDGVVFVSNGNSLRAEYLRILAECGKVGVSDSESAFFSYWSRSDCPAKGRVPNSMLDEALRTLSVLDERITVVGERLALMDAYAAADLATRQEWERKTRAMVPGVDTDCDWCDGLGANDTALSCGRCKGTGRITDCDWCDGLGANDTALSCGRCKGTGRIAVQQEVTT